MLFDNIEENIYSSKIQDSLILDVSDAVDSKPTKKPYQKRKTMAKLTTTKRVKKIKTDTIGDYCLKYI